MKKITFMSFKGGAGKSTSLYLLVAALNEKGKRVAVVNADENDVLNQWREFGRALDTWDDENIQIWKAEDEEDLEDAARGADSFGAEYMVFDTAGGGSDLNQAIIYNSDIVIIPTDLGRQELDQTLETMEYIQIYLQDVNANVLSGFLLNRVPLEDKNFSQEEIEGWEVMAPLPMFGTRIPFDKRIKGQKAKGLMNRYRDDLDADKASRFRAPQYTKLLNLGHDLIDEIEEALKAQSERDVVAV